MGGFGYKFKKHMETFGPFYIRVLLGSILLMGIGLLLFFVGYTLVGNKVLLFGNGEHVYNVYVFADMGRKEAVLISGTRRNLFTVNMERNGIIVMSITTAPQNISVIIYVVDTNSGKEVYHYEPGPGTQPAHSLRIELGAGVYTVYVYAPPGSNGNIIVDYKVYYASENPNYVVSRWLQYLGMGLSGMGLVTLILSYEIARKEAEAAYLVPPKEFREMIAEQSYLRLSARTANIRGGEEIIFHEEYFEEEE